MSVEDIITNLVEDLAKKVMSKIYDVGSDQYDKALVSFNVCFKTYLKRSYDRFSKIKTLLYRDRPVELKSHYVQTNFRIGHTEIESENAFDYFVKNKNNIIVGTAGSGKSVFMRRLFMSLVDDKNSYIPILIELRLLITSEGHASIFDYIFKVISDLNDDFTSQQLDYALKKGKVALLLDGFDEIDHEKKDIYAREIIELSNKYYESIFLVTSRPDEIFSSWDEFHVYRILPLNKSQAVDLISKIDYDTIVKEKFISELSNGLFEKHKDFLSNPLLLTMMLLTYEQLAEIPEKVHIFYEQAFDTLYHKHDALKALYKRKSYCGLPIDDFKRIFSAFCIVTYSERKFIFSEAEVLSYIEKAIDIENFNVEIDPINYFKDLLESVCIIQKDGSYYSFSHRSFQEYFSAYFISKSKAINIASVLNKIALNSGDSVIKMLYELNKELVEKEWFIPELEKIINKTKDIDVKNQPIKYLHNFYDSFHLGMDEEDEEEYIGFGLSEKIPEGYFFSLIRQLNNDKSKKYYLNQTEEERKAEIMVFQDVCASYSSSTLLFSYLENDDTSWLSQTSIPNYCMKYSLFLNDLHQELTDKYAKKSSDLASLLFR